MSINEDEEIITLEHRFSQHQEHYVLLHCFPCHPLWEAQQQYHEPSPISIYQGHPIAKHIHIKGYSNHLITNRSKSNKFGTTDIGVSALSSDKITSDNQLN